MKKFWLVALFISGSAFAGLFDADNYEDCVLEGLKDAQSELAAELVRDTCLQKFAEQTKKISPASLVEQTFLCDIPAGSFYTLVINPEEKFMQVDNTRVEITGETETIIYAERGNGDIYRWSKVDHFIRVRLAESGNQVSLQCTPAKN